MPTTEINADKLVDGKIGILNLMVACGLAPSNKQARQLVEQGGVLVNDEKVSSAQFTITEEQLKAFFGAAFRSIKPGGALAFSFNLNTLRRREVEQALAETGLEVLTEGPYADFSHWVEQAVDRDVVIARKPLNK